MKFGGHPGWFFYYQYILFPTNLFNNIQGAAMQNEELQQQLKFNAIKLKIEIVRLEQEVAKLNKSIKEKKHELDQMIELLNMQGCSLDE